MSNEELLEKAKSMGNDERGIRFALIVIADTLLEISKELKKSNKPEIIMAPNPPKITECL